MASGVLMPKAGITVEECMITKWEKKVGDKVAIGDILFSYETDKAAFECESTAEGELLEIFFDDGDQVPVLINVCAIGEKGEDVSSLRPNAEAEDTAEETVVEEVKEEVKVEFVSTKSDDDEIKISPRAKNLAQKKNIDISKVTPTGPYGRIIERDVRNYTPEAVVETAETAATAPVQESEYTDVKFSGIRRSISKAMQTSLTEMAQLTHNHSFDATEILNYRKTLKANAETLGLPNITINDIILYAVSRTLPQFPDFNAHLINGDTVRQFKNVNLGVATDTERGLMVPTIFAADKKSLTEISAEAKGLINEAKGGAIDPSKLTNGTFTVTNLGSLGVESFTPVINPPQTAILGVCSVVTRIKEVNGEIKTYPAMGLSLTYDHRVIDGAPAARFMQALIKNLENFTLLLAK